MARVMAPSSRSAHVRLTHCSLRRMLQAKKLEDTLWQKVFYSPISEFRKRLAAPKPGDARGQELRQKASTHFLAHPRLLLRHCSLADLDELIAHPSVSLKLPLTCGRQAGWCSWVPECE